MPCGSMITWSRRCTGGLREERKWPACLLRRHKGTGTATELAERIRGEVIDLERSIECAQEAWQRAQRIPADRVFFLGSVALNLHVFYSAVERLFELIARHVDRETPSGEVWHRTLLEAMARDLPESRPAVISTISLQELDRFRRFRHLVRNVYATNLLPEKMADLVAALPILWERLREEPLAFASFLDQVGMGKP